MVTLYFVHLSRTLLPFLFSCPPFAHNFLPRLPPVLQIIFHSGKKRSEVIPLQQTYISKPIKIFSRTKITIHLMRPRPQKAITEVKETKAEEHKHTFLLQIQVAFSII